MVYEKLAERVEKLDRRLTNYQFDVETDVAWARIAEPGLYFPWSFVADFGVPTNVLEENSEAGSLFQWAYAVSMCEAFIALEDMILDFVALERENLPATRSLTLLCDEEKKHVELFQRLGAELRKMRPDDTERFDAAYAPTRKFFEEMLTGYKAHEEKETLHFVFWLLTTFFEEFTIYVDDKLRGNEAIQPTWASAHAAHRREETQHVVTDLAYLDTIRLDAPSRDDTSEIFLAALARGLPRFTGYDAALAMVHGAHPEIGSIAPSVPTMKTPFFRAVSEAPQFRRTRQHAPALARTARRG